jgi:hypothetical protein
MKRRALLCLAWIPLLASSAAGDQAALEELLRKSGLAEEEIERILEDPRAVGSLSEEQIRRIESAEERPRRPTAEGYLSRGEGESNELQLRNAAASDLDLARAVLFREEMRSATWPDDAVLQGLRLGGGYGTLDHTRVLDLLEDAFPLYPPLDRRREAVAGEWAAAFWYLHKDAAYELARQAVANTALTPQQRALHLLVFQYAGYDEFVYGKAFRPMALETYRPYLRASEPDLQRAALIVARTLRDYDVLNDLKDVALSSTDPKARIDAWAQVVNLLEQGPKPEPRGIRRLGGFDPSPVGAAYDPEGLRIWLEAVKPEWQREQHRLLTGEEPPPAPVRSERSEGALPPPTSGGAGYREP